MPPETPSPRRFALALTAAVASTTIAIGATAASLLGWLRPVDAPASGPPTASEPAAAPAMPAATPGAGPGSVIFVPVTPAAPAAAPAPVEDPGAPLLQLAADERDRHGRHERDAHEGRRHHEEREEDDDD